MIHWTISELISIWSTEQFHSVGDLKKKKKLALWKSEENINEKRFLQFESMETSIIDENNRSVERSQSETYFWVLERYCIGIGKVDIDGPPIRLVAFNYAN